MKKLRVAIVGQGRSGRDIHGAFFRSELNEHFDVVAVVDKDPERRERALKEYPGCEAFDSHTKLYGRTDIDLVVDASYSHNHYFVTKDLLEHKFNVLTEKPFGANYYQSGDLIRTAKENGVMVTAFQQTLVTPVFLETKEYINSGKLGELMQITIRYNGLARRWDWQTVQRNVAGGIYNTGPHPIGFAMGFLDFDKDVKVAYSKLGCCLTSGDSDDYAKIILTAPNKPVVDIEVSSIDAYSDFTFKVQGSKGTYICTQEDWKATYIVDGENPERPVILESLKNSEGLPAYCSEKLITHTEEGKFGGGAFDIGTKNIYDSIFEHLTEGKPLCVTPEMAARTVNVIETVHSQNPLPVKY